MSKQKTKFNQISTIYPYKYHGQWVFDDESVGLNKEALVANTDTIMDLFCKKFGCDPKTGLIIKFSSQYFPGYNVHAVKLRDEVVGTWYQIQELDMEFWLCPALEKYISPPPAEMFATISPAQ